MMTPAKTIAALAALSVVFGTAGVSRANELRSERVVSALSDSSDVAAVVHAYHRALTTGDSSAALALLAADAVILESGGVETRDDYRSHHLPGDIQFAQAVPGTRADVRVTIRGDVAWAWSTSVTQGEYRGRAINSAGAELMVLTRTAQGWRISAIHWSSRTRRP
ncbi:MAG: nuclear transport factor 2 family protein [Gemmatimonadota bacterium]